MACEWNILHVTSGILHPPGMHYNPVIRVLFCIILVCCQYIILQHGTSGILHLCHLGICMYSVEAHMCLTVYPYARHIEEGKHFSIYLQNVTKGSGGYPPCRRRRCLGGLPPLRRRNVWWGLTPPNVMMIHHDSP